MSEKIIWHRLNPEALEYCMDVGRKRDIYRNAQGAINRRVGGHDTTPTNQLGVKGEYAFAAILGLRLPTASPAGADPGWDYQLSRFRIDVKTNGSLRRKDLLTPKGRGELDKDRVDIAVLACTASLEDPWVGLVGWIGVDSYLKQRTFHSLEVKRDGKPTKVPTYIVPQRFLNEIETLPGWPQDVTKAIPAPAYQSEQNRLL